MALSDWEAETYLSGIYPPANDALTVQIAKTLLQAQPIDEDKTPIGKAFDCVMHDSDTESQFAHDCSMDERVRFFFKLPSKFKIPTPLGSYNPDWAVVFEDADNQQPRVYFVAETKSSLVGDDLRLSEQLKISCGEKHFGLICPRIDGHLLT